MEFASSHRNKVPVLRAARGQHLLPGLPPKLTQILVLTDLEPGSRAAVECAIELASLFTARLALMNAGPLRSRHALEKHDAMGSPDSDPAMQALLCLMWEVWRRGLEVGMCAGTGSAPEQVLRTAANRNVDLIVLPEGLFGSFRPLANGIPGEESVEGAPCPLLVLEDRTNLPVEAGRSNFGRHETGSACHPPKAF